ncbi:MAG: DNA-binding protein WhiA [Clostridia bacterium]|nr:DNA-binding protein WhiA [Clostridia bacterium]
MSFCNDVKSELALLKGAKCCQRAESVGLSLGLKPCADGLIFRTGQADVMYLTATLLNKFLGQAGTERVSASGRWYTLTYAGRSAADESTADLAKPCCAAAFLRGVFLSCGQMTDPHKNYRLDLLVPDEATGALVCDVLREQDFLPRRSLRRDGSVCVYFIDSASIEDLLTLMGATGASLSLMEIKVEKNYTNTINRRGNFDTANYLKTYGTAAAQVAAIQWLRENGALDGQPEPTRRVAQLRLENTDASLNELAALAHMGRSSVDRRLKSLISLCQSLQKGS